MSADPEPSHAPSSVFLERFRSLVSPAGWVRFDRFVELALYDPKVGYYRRERTRVGCGAGTDFYTATTAGPVFGELIVASCVHLLGRDLAAQHTFVEIGAEPGRGVLDSVLHPFAGVRTIRVGDPLDLPERSIVFSNELFDAQPFRRFVRRGESWREIGVTCAGSGLEEVEIPAAPSVVGLPPSAPEGYRIDISEAAAGLAEQIAAPGWSGLFVAFDYGKTWREIVEDTPQGTARAYWQHRQSNDLLARPGEQDLTCHACWDHLIDVLHHTGFRNMAVESQEAFFVHHAQDYIASAIAAEAARFSARKQSLLQLLHPGNLGQKFQVLSAFRG